MASANPAAHLVMSPAPRHTTISPGCTVSASARASASASSITCADRCPRSFRPATSAALSTPSTGASPADLTWRAGVDALSFGFVKNGGMNAEALVFFRPELAEETLFRRKRAGHLLSKGRYLAAQLLAMLDRDLWLDCARGANAGAALLAEAAAGRLVHPVEANEVFLRVTADEAARLRAQGFDFYDWGPGEARLVVSWDQGADAIRPLADAIRGL